MGSLRNTYGELILKKGTILYNSSSKTDTFIFLNFHPSEFVENKSGYVTKIMLKRDVVLLFLIEADGDRMYSALGETDEEYNYSELCDKLSQEPFDGWFTLNNTNASIEVGLLNNPDVFSLGASTNLECDWKLCYYICDNLFIRTDWGINYKIYTDDFPIILNINSKYKNMIDYYINDGKKKYYSLMFTILIRNAEIQYFDCAP